MINEVNGNKIPYEKQNMYTTTGYKASTTGNITGIYDMSGGAWECLAAHLKDSIGYSNFTSDTIGQYDSKYFDVYLMDDKMENRILGDATGEMGPFYSYKFSDGIGRSRNHWYLDDAYTVANYSPWFMRGGDMYNWVVSGQFNFNRNKGSEFNYLGSRLVLD